MVIAVRAGAVPKLDGADQDAPRQVVAGHVVNAMPLQQFGFLAAGEAADRGIHIDLSLIHI